MRNSLAIIVLLLSVANIFSQNVEQSQLLAINEGISRLNTDENGITIETKIVIEKEEQSQRVKIIFWQETNNGFFFKHVNWQGNVELTLQSGEIIKLVDREMNGHSVLKGGHVGGYFVPDLYQRYAAYYLTDSECEKLKSSKVINVTYHLDDEFETSAKYLLIKDAKNRLGNQLVAIGK